MTRRRIISLVIITIAAGILIAVSVFFWNNFRGVIPLLRRPSVDITEAIPDSGTAAEEEDSSGPDLQEAEEEAEETPEGQSGKDDSDKSGEDEDGILDLARGFRISILSADVPAARVLALGPEGDLWISQTGIGRITRIMLEDGKSAGQEIVFEGLDNPHGLAFDPREPNTLYIAEEKKISRVMLDGNGDPQGGSEKVIDLPGGGRHYTRTIGFASDGRLYVSIGSTCDVCNESDERLASIYSLNKDGSDFKLFASGLRNAVFFRWHPLTGEMWATEMGRDNLGDDLPPDEINIILEGRDYGWPYCYGKNIQDKDFDSSPDAASRCSQAEPSHIDLQAHSAPLGLDFIPEGGGWPEGYGNNLLVAYHGSWNRSVPTGYKIVRFVLDSKGNLLEREDFISGWLTEDGKVLGRPVDILVLPGGEAYISDDRAGVIYRLEYRG